MRLPDVGYRTDGGRYEEFALDAPYLSAMAIGTPGGTRTPDPLLRRQPLCPLSYRRKSRSDCTRVAKSLPHYRWAMAASPEPLLVRARRASLHLNARISDNHDRNFPYRSILSPQFEH